MPNRVRFAVPAGACVMFDIATWHTSMPNRGGAHGGLDGSSRCTVEIDYRSSETPYSGSSTGRAWGDVCLGKRVGVTEKVLRRLAKEGRLPVSRRRMLGLPDEGFGEEEET